MSLVLFIYISRSIKELYFHNLGFFFHCLFIFQNVWIFIKINVCSCFFFNLHSPSLILSLTLSFHCFHFFSFVTNICNICYNSLLSAVQLIMLIILHVTTYTSHSFVLLFISTIKAYVIIIIDMRVFLCISQSFTASCQSLCYFNIMIWHSSSCNRNILWHLNTFFLSLHFVI